MNTSNTELQHINQNDIECDLRHFTIWLNDLVDQVNWLTNVYTKLQKQVAENTEDIRLIKLRLDALEASLRALTERVDNIEQRVYNIEHSGTSGVIDMINGRVDMLYGWLPIPYGMIDAKGWKFAMGNISAMSTTESPENTDGPGIYTSGEVEDNDVTFK